MSNAVLLCEEIFEFLCFSTICNDININRNETKSSTSNDSKEGKRKRKNTLPFVIHQIPCDNILSYQDVLLSPKDRIEVDIKSMIVPNYGSDYYARCPKCKYIVFPSETCIAALRQQLQKCNSCHGFVENKNINGQQRRYFCDACARQHMVNNHSHMLQLISHPKSEQSCTKRKRCK